ncbi:MAG: hypothetical protein Q8N26_29735 [Myxococcales bacterium]|nr:hypothetical protein [Myxococcales bacterium]
MSSALDSAWRAVQESPDDVSRLEVLADLLLQEGDSFGELVRLELEQERSAGDALSSTIEQRRSGITSTLRHELAAGDWRRGFVLATTGTGAPTLERCLEHPAFRLLRELGWTFGPADGLARIHQVLTSLPRTVRKLTLSGTDLEDGTLQWLSALTGLEHLETDLPFNLEGAKAEGLRSLQFHTDGLDPASLESVWFPRLIQLELFVQPWPERWPTSFLSGTRSPALKRLFLKGALMPHHLEDLASSGLLRGIEELTLDVQHLSQFDEILSDTADRFDHLKRFRRPVPR